jgi:hypothetical protein
VEHFISWKSKFNSKRTSQEVFFRVACQNSYNLENFVDEWALEVVSAHSFTSKDELKLEFKIAHPLWYFIA